MKYVSKYINDVKWPASNPDSIIQNNHPGRSKKILKDNEKLASNSEFRDAKRDLSDSRPASTHNYAQIAQWKKQIQKINKNKKVLKVNATNIDGF